jgi:hypothetical protein
MAWCWDNEGEKKIKDPKRCRRNESILKSQVSESTLTQFVDPHLINRSTGTLHHPATGDPSLFFPTYRCRRQLEERSVQLLVHVDITFEDIERVVCVCL